MARYTTKFLEKHGGKYLGGLRLRFIDGDYDWCRLKSLRYRYTKKLYERMLQIKNEHEQDYIRCEYDCTGSTQVRISIKRKGRYLFMYYYESKDV
jgi:hypothetical protein